MSIYSMMLSSKKRLEVGLGAGLRSRYPFTELRVSGNRINGIHYYIGEIEESHLRPIAVEADSCSNEV